ncbi:hypothetical protein [Pseudoxanthomonas kaohsiungensis]|uniref:Uncharacterized protein n=1 Tax=Pseudoxanthomonas kaohsiungensis TaxID=283923 RepID=A0ABW3M1M3_9GAMM|nr:hypothetical protein [Pseudoxanthomonas kaohsiungensis]KAF1704968.1 hypothetical protein CSC66_00005 [Pseudoxanthomonas kaohsiungensis]
MRKFLALVVMLACGQAWAGSGSMEVGGTQPAEVQRVVVAGLGSIDYQPLFEAVSEPGETLDAFVIRVAPRLVAYSDTTGFEACGVLASNGDRFGLAVGTNRSHVACASFRNKVPAGMVSTAETVHSHGKGAARLNRNDLRFLGLSEDARSHRMFGTLHGQDRFRFSERDLAGEAGYLATPHGVVHHNGGGQTRAVMP